MALERKTGHALGTDRPWPRPWTPTSTTASPRRKPRRRLAELGPNELKEKPRAGILKMLWDQINNYLIIILIVAAVISMALGEAIDALAILAIVVLNAVLGVVQESRAEQALAALKRMAAPNAQVIRDGVQVHRPRPRAGGR